ncbi:MAG: type IV pilus assembly protein PilM [Planctomycetes bacterium]|nr:type IV pilus assembly protein PilM [Planctomycetota bacterium]
MAANRPVWGIDLGQCALKAISLRLSEDKEKVEVVDHVYVEHSRILSHPDADRPALIAEAMKKFTEQHDLSKETLVVSVPGQHTLARFTKLPPLENKRKIPELVHFEAQQQIPFDMEEVIWDYQVFEDPKAGEIEVGIFAMRRDLLRDQLQYLTGINLEPAVVQSSPLALYNALRYDGICTEEPVCILDIGTQNTDLIVVVEGRSLWTRNIPIGGNAFTEVLLKTFKLSFGKAERLKRDAQKHKYARQIFQAMRPVFADLVAEIQRSIGFFTSSRRGVRLNKIIAMGNAFKLPGMVKFIQQNLGMDVVRPTSFNKLAAGGAPNASALAENLLSYGVAYGLALQGLGLSQITSNLLPTDIAKQVIWRRKTPWFYGAAAALALSAAIVWGRNLADANAVSAGRGNDPTPSFQVQYDANDTERRNPMHDPAAAAVLAGNFAAQSPIGKAKEIAAAADHFNEVLNLIASKNDARAAQAADMVKLEVNEAVWPNILYMIHSVLPRPDAEMAEALEQGPEAVKKLVQSNPQYERSKRKEIYILSLTSNYSPDVMTEFAMAGMEKTTGGAPAGIGMPPGGGGEDVAAPAPANQKGFLVDFVIRCPNEQQFTYVDTEFLAKLRTAVVPPVCYVAKVRVHQRVQLKDGGVSGLAGGAGGGQPTEILLDPVTGESMREDWEYAGTMAVVLGEKPRSPSEASPSPDAAGGQPAAESDEQDM